jgi:hypothetical protein
VGIGSGDDAAAKNSSLRLNSAGVAIVSANQVTSQADLEVFAENIVKVNKSESVTKVEIDSKNDGEVEIKVAHKGDGRFLGFMPVTLTTTVVVEVSENGNLEVRSDLPWWSFLVAKKAYNKTDLETRIANNETIQANAQVNASAAAQARIAEAVIAEFEAYAQTQASVQG